MRFHLSLSLAAALAVASVIPANAGSMVDPMIEGETMVAPDAKVGSMGSLGGGAILGILALVVLAAAAGGGSSSASGT